MKRLSIFAPQIRLLFLPLALAVFAADALCQEQVIFPFSSAGSESSYNAAPVRDAKGDLYAVSDAGVVFQLAPPVASGGQWLVKTSSPVQDTAFSYGLAIDHAANVYGTATASPSGDYIFEVFAPCCETARIVYQFPTSVLAPTAPAVDANGNLYGIASGDVFELIKPATKQGTWTLTTIYTFLGTTDGCDPTSVTVDKLGNLYGITTACGTNGTGTVFQLIPPSGSGSWTEKTLYTFPAAGAARAPKGYSGFVVNTLTIDAAGNLFGTNWFGGDSNNGYVFELTPASGGSWTFSTLYSFKGVPDGWLPGGSVTVTANGHLFGTTYFGGPVTKWAGAANGLGTLYELIPPAVSGGAWTERIVHNFTGGYDGFLPASTPIIGYAGALYGTTTGGGNNSYGGFGGERACCGAVYQYVP